MKINPDLMEQVYSVSEEKRVSLSPFAVIVGQDLFSILEHKNLIVETDMEDGPARSVFFRNTETGRVFEAFEFINEEGMPTENDIFLRTHRKGHELSEFPGDDWEELDDALEQIKVMLGIDDDAFSWTHKDVQADDGYNHGINPP